MEKKDQNYNKLETRLAALEAQYTYIKTDPINNTASIQNIKNDQQNPPVSQASAENTKKINELELVIKDMQKHLNGIEQYVRVNNLEIIGLDEVKDGDFGSNEEKILAAINSLEHLPYEVTKNDIDISHPIPTRRKDGKNVSVCRFVSRKTKFDILEAKKQCRDFQFNNKKVYINEHLMPENRRIFAEASKKRKELNFKYIWTINGITHMRKADGDVVLVIDNDEALQRLA